MSTTNSTGPGQQLPISFQEQGEWVNKMHQGCRFVEQLVHSQLAQGIRKPEANQLLLYLIQVINLPIQLYQKELVRSSTRAARLKIPCIILVLERTLCKSLSIPFMTSKKSYYYATGMYA